MDKKTRRERMLARMLREELDSPYRQGTAKCSGVLARKVATLALIK